jgi:DNA-binding transcriptional LysR family regulator
MEFRDIDYFAVLAGHGHVGRPAEALGLSPPALSLSLRRLETSMRAKLFARTPKGVELTVTGSALLAQVKRLRLARNDVLREAAEPESGTRRAFAYRVLQIINHLIASSNLLGFNSRVAVRQATLCYRDAELRIKELTYARRAGIVYREGAYLSPAARRFIEILKTTAKGALEKP